MTKEQKIIDYFDNLTAVHTEAGAYHSRLAGEATNEATKEYHNHFAWVNGNCAVAMIGDIRRDVLKIVR